MSTLLAGYTVWPLVHVINFRFIPSSQRVLYINCVQARFSPQPALLPCFLAQPGRDVSKPLCLHMCSCPRCTGGSLFFSDGGVCRCAQVLWNTILCKIATNKSTEIVLEPNPHLENHPQPASA